jgi:hypothetical protein
MVHRNKIAEAFSATAKVDPAPADAFGGGGRSN